MCCFDFYAAREPYHLIQWPADPGGEIIAGGTDLIPQLRDG